MEELGAKLSARAFEPLEAAHKNVDEIDPWYRQGWINVFVGPTCRSKSIFKG